MITNSSSSAASSTRRAGCESCNRPASACICHWATPVATQVEVVLLQHPLELKHPKGSARLLHLSLPGSVLLVAERIADAALHDLLYSPLGSAAKENGKAPSAVRQPILLYPRTDDVTAGDMRTPAALDPAQVRLVVLDGTWRKSRRMLHEHPLLQTLPRLALDAPPPSRYRIRHAHRADQLSTLEATCHALAQLEKDEAKYQPLLHAFDKFIEAQQAWFFGKEL